MVQQLADDQMRIVNTLKAALVAAQEADDEVSIGLIVDRMSVHEKAAWMLRSSV